MDSYSIAINFMNTTNCTKKFYYCNEEIHTNLLKNGGLMFCLMSYILIYIII